MKVRIVMSVVAVAVALVGVPTAAAAATAGSSTKVTVCRVTRDGTAVPLRVNPRALPAFVARGYPLPGDEAAPGYVYDDSCQQVRACVGLGSFHGTFLERGFRYPMTATIRCGDVGEVIADVDYPVFGQCEATWTLTAIVSSTTIEVEESIDDPPCESGWTYRLTYDPATDRWNGYHLDEPTDTFRLRRD